MYSSDDIIQMRVFIVEEEKIMHIHMRVITGILVCAGICAANLNSGTQQGVVRTKSAKTLGSASMRVGMGTNYAQSTDFFEWRSHPRISNLDGLDNTASLLSSNIYLTMGVLSWWDIGVQLPFYWDGVLEEDGGPSDFAIGDFEISSKMLYPPPTDQRLFYQSYIVGIAADLTGMNGGIYPRHSYYYHSEDPEKEPDVFNAERFVIKGGLLWTLDFRAPCCKTPLQLHVNGIVNIPTNGDREITGDLNAGLEYVPADVFTFFVEYASEIRAITVIEDITNIRRDPMWVTPGIKVTSPTGIFVKIGADIGVSEREKWFTWGEGSNKRYRTSVVPQWGVQFAFGWKGFLTAQDADHDGIKDDVDRCPKDAEDIDGFEDADGCPDNDNDSDGIPDKEDKCPDEAEDDDGHQDSDGCPDRDNDEDGIPDVEDKCPKEAEDFDGYEDGDGCADTDNDKDGVPDSLDKCINEAEDFDRFEDEDGCPDLDNDQDGIKDIEDKCPNKPETFNNYKDEDGCPDEKKKEKKECDFPQHKVMRGVNFKSGHSEMTFDSYKYLNPIVKKMKECPEVKIEVQGHTDSMGKLSTNMRLSRMRAQSVKQYLVSQGIDPERIVVQGYGPKRPIADNRTASGRQENRRIEIKRIK